MLKHFFVFALLTLGYLSKAQSLYFPPTAINNQTWDTLSPSSLGWCVNKIQPLYDFLETENSKALIVLKDGKIVLEKYFGTFTKDSVWYWASAGKTLTAFLVGKAQEEGKLSIKDSTSKYLGKGWTSCSAEQEGKISNANQITMTTGLDDGGSDNHCTLPTCLQYKAAAGTRWAYHNAPYTMLEKVIEAATKQNINTYTNAKLRTQTGITGAWFTSDYDNVFYSKPRNMARFGLLAQNKFVWNTTPLLTDKTYIDQLTNTSQNLNLSYGYLWWLNGKKSFMLPTLQFVFNGPLCVDAPEDMFAGIGKNGQLVSVAPSKGIVVVRMGNAPSGPGSEVSTVLLNQIWQHLNGIMCNSTVILAPERPDGLSVSHATAQQEIIIQNTNQLSYHCAVTDLAGRILLQKKSNQSETLQVHTLSNGVYLLSLRCENGQTLLHKFVIQH